MGERNYSGCAVLNTGCGAWAFEEHARRLSRALWLDVSEDPREYVYLLGWDLPEPPQAELFIPYRSILLAGDKRLLAGLFPEAGVSAPRTLLLNTPDEVCEAVRSETGRQWVLKYPTGCGASGHRLLDAGSPVPEGWPRPYVVQEFIRLETPEVYRLYCAGGETFGWNV